MTTEIIINLEESRAARVLKKEEWVQQNAYVDFDNILERLLLKAKDYDPSGFEEIREHYHETIFIGGERGFGKTTFILNKFDELKDKSTNRRVCPLGIIDPTLIKKDKERVFLDIVSRIKKEVDKHSYNPSASQFQKGEYEEWLGHLRRLAVGLSQLDSHGGSEQEYFDEYMFLEKGLDDIRQGTSLELDFHKFVERSKHILKIDAFIVVFDDIDTDFKSGWPVLEVIRKYLTTPHLVVVLCGDPNLYTKLVRMQQWGMLDGLAKYEQKNHSVIENLVDELEEQYMLKILKPINWIHMRSVKFYMDQPFNQYSITVKKTADGYPYPIMELLSQLCSKVLKTTSALIPLYKIANDRYSKEVMDMLLAAPIRTLIAVLNVSIKLVEFDTGVSRPLPEEIYHDLTDIFLPVMFRYQYGIREIANIDSNSSLKQLVINLNQLGVLVEGHRLRGELLDKEKNIFFLVLGTHYSRYLSRHPAGYIDYFIILGLAREMALQWPFRETNDKSSIDTPQKRMERYIKHVGIDSSENSLQTARKFISFFRAQSSRRTIRTGTLRLYPEEVQSSDLSMFWKKYFSKKNREEVDKLLEKVKNSKKLRGRNPAEIEQDVNEELHPLVGGTERGAIGQMWRFAIKRHLYHKNIDLGQPEDAQRNKTGQKKKQIFQNYFNTVRTLERAIVSYQRYFVTLLVSTNMSRGGEYIPYASFFNLLGTISLILSADNAQGIHDSLYKYSQIRVFPTYETGAGSSVELGVKNVYEFSPLADQAISDEHRDEIIDGFNKFCNLLDLWRSQAIRLEGHPLPVELIARIWGRFYAAINYMDNVLPNNDLFVGNVMHRVIVSFLNAVLVELLMDNYGDSIQLNLRQPILRDRVFTENLDCLYKMESYGKPCYEFFSFIFACPVWGLYLCPRNDFMTKDNPVMYEYLERTSAYFDIPKADLMDIFEVKYGDSNNTFRNLYTPLNSIMVMISRPSFEVSDDTVIQLVEDFGPVILEQAREFKDSGKLFAGKNITAFINNCIRIITEEIEDKEAAESISKSKKAKDLIKKHLITAGYITK